MKHKSKKRPPRMNGVEAVYGLLGWLTSRTEVSGPFSSSHNASQAAELAAEFCRVNGLGKHRRCWPKNLTHPVDKLRYPQRLPHET